MYSLISIYIIIPFIFSHIFSRLGASFLISNGIGSFESIKVEIFLFLILFSVIEALIFISNEKWNKIKDTGSKIVISIIFFAGISPILYSYQNITNIFLGTGEKQHGILLVIGLILLAFLISILNTKEIKKISYTIIGTGVCIACIAIIEAFFKYNLFTGASFVTTGSWGDFRSIATLGNPNYVAGYLLMLLPMILGYIHRFEKYILFVVVCFGILATKSVIGISLAGVYIFYSITRTIWRKSHIIGLVLISIPILIFIYHNYYESDKWLSLTSRFILMKHVLIGYIQGSPLSLLFGNGPDSISGFFSGNRASEITAYFPRNMIIDSSHNVIIDILFSYGLIGLGIVIGYIMNSWERLSYTNKSVCILGFLFFLLNVIVIVPLLIFIFVLQNHTNSKNIH